MNINKFSKFSLIVFIVLAFSTSSLFAQNKIDELKNKIDKRNSDIAELEKQIQSYQKQINVLNSQSSSLKSTLKTLQLTREKLEKNIALTQDKITAKNFEIQKLN
jgi:septal ring factor EnvC (AmiA/AmiB activator)